MTQDTFLGLSWYENEEDEVILMVVKTEWELDENRGRYGLSKSDMTHRQRENLWGLEATHQAWMMEILRGWYDSQTLKIMTFKDAVFLKQKRAFSLSIQRSPEQMKEEAY